MYAEQFGGSQANSTHVHVTLKSGLKFALGLYFQNTSLDQTKSPTNTS